MEGLFCSSIFLPNVIIFNAVDSEDPHTFRLPIPVHRYCTHSLMEENLPNNNILECSCFINEKGIRKDKDRLTLSGIKTGKDIISHSNYNFTIPNLLYDPIIGVFI